MTHTNAEDRTSEANWSEVVRFDDAGDVGGDIQAGPAHSLIWTRQLESGEFETLTLYRFAAHDPQRTKSPWFVCDMTEIARHSDPADPGATETGADYRYDDRDMPSRFASSAALFAKIWTDADEHGTTPEQWWWDIDATPVSPLRLPSAKNWSGFPAVS
jgi:hypothetical protein